MDVPTLQRPQQQSAKVFRSFLNCISREGEFSLPMKNPPHPGGFVMRQCIMPLGLTVTDPVYSWRANNLLSWFPQGSSVTSLYINCVLSMLAYDPTPAASTRL